MLKKLFTTTNLFVFLILALAAFLRLYRIGDYLTFLGDEGRDVLVVYNILHGHLTLLGPTASVGGFFLGPIYYYFMTPFLWLFHYNPVGPAVMVALVGILTVWLVYAVGKRFFSPTAGLIAALLYAISPVVIAYSRSSWNPNVMPFFSLLTLLALYHAFNKNKPLFFVVSGFLLGIAMQLHYLSTFLAVIIFVYILLASLYDFFFHPTQLFHLVGEIILRYALYGFGFIIGWSPFLFFEVRHGFENIKSILAFVLYSKETGSGIQFLPTVTNVFFRLFGRLITAYPPPEQVTLQDHLNITIWYFSTLALAIAATLFLVFCLKRVWGNREKFLQISLLFVWFVLGTLLFGLYKKMIYDYYFTFLFPVPFLITAAFFAALFQKNIWLKGIATLSIGILVVLNLLGMPFRFAPNRQLAQVEQISKVVFDHTQGKPYNFALITGGNSDHAYRYFLTVWGHPPVTIENPAVDPQRKSVTSQLLVVCEQLPCHPEGASLWEVAGFGRAQIVGEWDVSVVKVYKLQHYTEPATSKIQLTSNK